ncbi:MAG: GNAT family N-acetyltransferase [Bacteroidales bacterium]|nr:GNAT family N-acetyltransferase [Bacteroidales bacterium]
MNTEIVSVNLQNLSEHPGIICFINPKHPSYSLKIDWLKERFSEGLKIKLLYIEGQKKAAGFIEYVPGEFAWRAVSAKNYMFIHCLYVYPNNNKNQGHGSQLIDECLKDAKEQNLAGAAAMVSQHAFMAEAEIFLKNGFSQADGDNQGNMLLVKQFSEAALPSFNRVNGNAKNYTGLNILYSRQCPWVARLIEEIREAGIAEQLGITITEIKSAAEAQQAPSFYGVFNFLRDGKVLADRYVSLTRFKNILKQEKLA